MRGWILSLLAGLCWAATPVQAARDVDRFIGRNVVEVELAVDGRPLDDAAVRELIETRVGEPLSMRQVRETLAHLFSLGLYRGVEVGAGARGDGVALLYGLRPIEIIDRIEFPDARGVPETELRRLIAQRHGLTFPASEVTAVADTIRSAYRDRGFFSASVRPEVVGPASRRVLRIAVETGSRVFVRRWPITGESPASHNAIRARLGLRDERLPYDVPAIVQRLSDYEADLRRRGYYEARLSHEVEQLSETEVDVRLVVRRGPRIAVTFEGDEVPGARLADLVPVAREASVDEDLLEDADQRIATHLQGLGYRDAAVSHTREGDGDQLSIVYRVTRGPPYRVGDVVVRGNRTVADETIRSIAGVAAGDPLVVREIDAGLAAIEEHYNRLGFATVRAVRSFSDVEPADGEAMEQTVEIEIDEGVRTIIGAVTFEGAADRASADLRQLVEVRGDDAYFGPQVERDRNALLEHYLNDGYEQARVTVDARFADDLATVDLVFHIAEGRQVLVDHVLIVGNRQVDAATIRREVTLVPGEPLGLDDVAETRRRLNALGMFRRIDIREFSHGRLDRRDVIIDVEEAAATTLAYGGGFEVSQRLRRELRAARSQAVERIEFAPRGSFEIGRRNLWGRNRSIDLFTRVSVRRKNDPPVPVPAVETGSALGFNEYRVLATYREPRAIGRDWDVLVSGFVEQAIRPGFDLFSRGVTAQLTRSSGAASGSAVGYRLGNNDTSNRELNREDENIVDRLFPNVRLSSFTGSQVLDTRDDPVDPARGSLVTFESEVAARTIGSEVGFSKSFLSGSLYRRVPRLPRIVIAAGARVGVAWGFPRSLDRVATPAEGQQPVLSSLALPLSERFFAGGNTTVRGFALDRLGHPRAVPGGTIDQDGFPQGGNAVVILNTELRIRATPAIGVVTFLDAGNVYDRVEHVSLGRIRSGAGFGVRYNSPVGPLGFDIGFKLGERHFFGDETNPQQEQLWALHFSFGQAF